MTCYLRNKFDNLDSSYASPRQTLDIVRTRWQPLSLACAFAVTPCTPADLIMWDTMIDRIIKHKNKLWNSTAAAMIREDCDNFETSQFPRLQFSPPCAGMYQHQAYQSNVVANCNGRAEANQHPSDGISRRLHI
eukprot:788375-Pelagomonas_calceolata.AAC.1